MPTLEHIVTTLGHIVTALEDILTTLEPIVTTLGAPHVMSGSASAAGDQQGSSVALI